MDVGTQAGDFVMMIGVPGSGKTTFVQERFHPDFVICPDEIRAALTGDASDQRRDKDIWRYVRSGVAQRLSDEQSVILDATGANAHRRKQMVAWAWLNGAKRVIAIWLDTPKEICQQRNAARERVVPDHVIERMYNNLRDDPPSIDEGFTEIWRPSRV